MLKRTGTKQRSDDRTTNLSRLIMTVICESVFICVVGKPVNPKCGLRVECVGNRHDDSRMDILQQMTEMILLNLLTLR